jgi:hypothetical protein
VATVKKGIETIARQDIENPREFYISRTEEEVRNSLQLAGQSPSHEEVIAATKRKWCEMGLAKQKVRDESAHPAPYQN